MSSAALLLALALGAPGATPDAEVAELLRAADAPRHLLAEGVMGIHAAVQERGKPAVETDLDVYVKGADRALCVFRSGKQQGRKLLTVGSRAWLIVPRASRAVPVSANQRLLGGASVADVASIFFAREFHGSLRAADEPVDGIACRVLDLVAASPRAPYAQGTLWLGKEDRLPRKARLALRSGKDAQEIRFTAFGDVHGRTALKQAVIHHLLSGERGMVTTLDFTRYEAKPLDDSFFDPVGARAAP